MGRELANIPRDKKSNGIVPKSNDVSDGKVISPDISEDSVEGNDYEVKECTEESHALENGHESQEVLGVKSTNFDTPPDERTKKHQTPRSSYDKNHSSPSSKPRGGGNNHMHQTVPRPFTLATERRASSITRASGAGTVNSAANTTSPTNNKNSQSYTSPLASRRLLQSDHKKHFDDEDNWSVASSTATSVRTGRSRVTVGSAPTFKSTERAEKRREFYQKLGEKQQALEEEKSQYEQRTREEQAEALKLMRKNLVVKANPIPSFYYEAPPPKVALKKLPLTRPKSPKLNRRKSCNDAINSPQEEKPRNCSRRSVGNPKEESSYYNAPKVKGRLSSHNSPCSFNEKEEPTKQIKERTSSSSPDIIIEQTNNDIAVES